MAEKIKTSITRRDDIFSDDWVDLSLDAMGKKQTAYDLFCNPNGIQGDILNSAVSGEDVAPDFVWESAGQLTDEGYQVEISIPLRSIRFKSGKEVGMGILLWRRISRLSTHVRLSIPFGEPNSRGPLGIMAAFEHIGKDFRMDSGFVRRTDLTASASL